MALLLYETAKAFLMHTSCVYCKYLLMLKVTFLLMCCKYSITNRCHITAGISKSIIVLIRR